MMKHPLETDEMLALLDRTGYAVISTTGADGYPYGTPVNFARLDGRIFFHGRKVGEKASNLERDPRCCMTVVEENGFERCDDGACDTTTLYESVIIRGKVRTVDDDAEKMRILRAIVDKLTPERRNDAIDERKVPPTGIFEVVVESMTGKYRRPQPGHRIYNRSE